ncbi:tumor necrosis factor receptor superfamily member 14-like isoform X2 [Gadus morhua]|uniref:tumor necrosis factor receptor superfamily member 14-like isoform X2 n=1 Tax=Gadus morhua TaxID=8049 RepID=UPI0011B356EF|nr:tumor necrosis factor receptor superfamily member 14-like isoform X2 [Gadus morhua]
MGDSHTNWTTMFLHILSLLCSVCNTYGVASTASPSCTSDEYRAGQVCCLACPGGYRVHRDCTATANTLCSKCPDGTFKEGLSGQKQCSNCTECGTGLGLKVKKSCSSTSDVLCKPLDGFFCIDSNGGGCRATQRHRLSCSPGHYIGRIGTADEDRGCLHCTYGTFSNGTSSCQPHTTCDSVGGVQIQPGTDSTDSTCITYVAIVFIIIGCICFIISLVLGALFYRRLKMEQELDRDLTEYKKQIDEMETLDQVNACHDGNGDPLLLPYMPVGIKGSK